MSINKGINPEDVILDHSTDKYVNIQNDVQEMMYDARPTMLTQIATRVDSDRTKSGKIEVRLPMEGANVYTGNDVASSGLIVANGACIDYKPECVGGVNYLSFDKGMPWVVSARLPKCNILYSGNGLTEQDFNNMVDEFLFATNENFTMVEDTYGVSTLIADPSEIPTTDSIVKNMRTVLANLSKMYDKDGNRQIKGGVKILTVSTQVWDALMLNEQFMACCTADAEKLAMLGVNRAAIGYSGFDLIIEDTTGLLESKDYQMVGHWKRNLHETTVQCEPLYVGPYGANGRERADLLVEGEGEKVVYTLRPHQIYAVKGDIPADQMLEVVSTNVKPEAPAPAPDPTPAPETIK